MLHNELHNEQFILQTLGVGSPYSHLSLVKSYLIRFCVNHFILNIG